MSFPSVKPIVNRSERDNPGTGTLGLHFPQGTGHPSLHKILHLRWQIYRYNLSVLVVPPISWCLMSPLDTILRLRDPNRNCVASLGLHGAILISYAKMNCNWELSFNWYSLRREPWGSCHQIYPSNHRCKYCHWIMSRHWISLADHCSSFFPGCLETKEHVAR